MMVLGLSTLLWVVPLQADTVYPITFSLPDSSAAQVRASFSGSSPVVIQGASVSLSAVPVEKGGTGAKTFNIKGVLYGNSTSAVSSTNSGSPYQVLQVSSSGVPLFDFLDLSQINSVTGILDLSKGGSGASTLTSNGILYGNGTGSVLVTSAGSQDQSLIVSGGVPSFGAIDLSQASAVTGALAVTNGGTGLSSISANSVLVSSGSSLVASAAGVSGGLLTSNGTTSAPTFQTSRFNVYSTQGIYTFIVPPGINTIRVSVIGAGGGGGIQASSGSMGGCSIAFGGGGGGYAEQTLSVTAGTSYTIQVGQGGAGGTLVMGGVDGGSSSFSSSGVWASASGGTAATDIVGGSGGVGLVGSTLYSGGNAHTSLTQGTGGGGAGGSNGAGSSGVDSSTGANGSNGSSIGGSAGSSGSSGFLKSRYGGAGGGGGASANGGNGGSPGGGGGGGLMGGSCNGLSGSGADGAIFVEY